MCEDHPFRAWGHDGKLWIGWKLPSNKSSVVLGVPGGIRRYLSNLAFQAVAKQGERQCGQNGINEGGSSYGYGTFLALLRRGRRRHVAGGVRLARKDVALSLVTDAILDRE